MKTTTPTISARQMARMDACADGLAAFRRVFGNGPVPITARNITRGRENQLNLSFLVRALGFSTCSCRYCNTNGNHLDVYGPAKEVAAALRAAMKKRKARR